MEIVDTILQYNGHMERTSFAVTNLRKQDVILGFTWLQEHNLEIDWQTWKVVMSRCLDKCHMCRMDVWKQRQEQQRVDHLVQVCRSSPHLLLLEEDLEGLEESDSDDFDSEVISLRLEDTLEGGEHLLSLKEQVELNAFLEENLCTGRIHSSKSLMASPVFIK